MQRQYRISSTPMCQQEWIFGTQMSPEYQSQSEPRGRKSQCSADKHVALSVKATPPTPQDVHQLLLIPWNHKDPITDSS